MLTIDQIKNISFRKSGRSGYNASDVDEFIDDVVVSFEQLQAEKAELLRKMDILATKVEQYRTDEETVRNALLSSQKVADSTLKDAKNKATYIIKSAEKKSRSILTEAEMATEREKDKFEALHSDTAKLRKEIIDLYKKHLAIVEEMPTEEDVAKQRAELDEKYPFEPVDDIINSVDEDLESEEEIIQANKNKDDEKNTDDTKRRETKREAKSNKFDQLKFGDNYDVE